MSKILSDDRIDPRIKAVMGNFPAVNSGDVPDRETLLAAVNTPEALARREGMQAMFSMMDNETIAPSTQLDIRTL